MWVHLAWVCSTRHAALFEVSGDGAVMDTEDLGEFAQRASGEVLGFELVDFCTVQSGLHWPLSGV